MLEGESRMLMKFSEVIFIWTKWELNSLPQLLMVLDASLIQTNNLLCVNVKAVGRVDYWIIGRL